LNIQALIDAATGGGEEAGYLLMTQARTRNPVFPIIETADFKINCSSPGAGTVRIPGGVSFLHRGIYIEETVETDFATLASKTYHLRWSYADGYALKDLSDVAYNPTSAAETSTIFDSTYDDMLIARVITNSSNVASITNLINNARIETRVSRASAVGDGGANSGTGPTTSHTLDFARTPLAFLESIYPPGGGQDSDANVSVTERTRYSISVYTWAWAASGAPHDSYGYAYNLVAG
jgi:hypothetical protein